MKLWQPVLTAAALLASGSAWAQQVSNPATGEFKTTILINKVCVVTTHTNTHEDPQGADINFGEHYSNKGEQVDGDSSVKAGQERALTVKCSQGTPFTIGLKPASSAKNDGTGEMTRDNGTEKIAYSLHQDASRNKPWGNEGNVVSKVGQGFKAGPNSENTFTVFGKIDAGQLLDKPAGRYNDTVNVTVTY